MDLLKSLIREGFIKDIDELVHEERVKKLREYHDRKIRSLSKKANLNLIQKVDNLIENNFFTMFFTLAILILTFLLAFQNPIIGFTIFGTKSQMVFMRNIVLEGKGIKIIEINEEHLSSIKIISHGTNVKEISIAINSINEFKKILLQTKEKDSIFFSKKVNINKEGKYFLIIKYNIEEGGFFKIDKVILEK